MGEASPENLGPDRNGIGLIMTEEELELVLRYMAQNHGFNQVMIDNLKFAGDDALREMHTLLQSEKSIPEEWLKDNYKDAAFIAGVTDQQQNEKGDWVPIPQTPEQEQAAEANAGQGQYGGGSSPRSVGNVAPSLEAALLAIGVAKRVESGLIMFVTGKEKEYIDKVNAFSREMDLPDTDFGTSDDQIAEANQWVQELGEPRRRQFLNESFDTYGTSLDVVMHDGTHRIVGLSELLK